MSRTYGTSVYFQEKSPQYKTEFYRPYSTVEATAAFRVEPSASSDGSPHLVSTFSHALCTSGCLLQQVGDDIIRNVKELFVDLLILTEIVIPG